MTSPIPINDVNIRTSKWFQLTHNSAQTADWWQQTRTAAAFGYSLFDSDMDPGTVTQSAAGVRTKPQNTWVVSLRTARSIKNEQLVTILHTGSFQRLVDRTSRGEKKHPGPRATWSERRGRANPIRFCSLAPVGVDRTLLCCGWRVGPMCPKYLHGGEPPLASGVPRANKTKWLVGLFRF